MPSLRSGAVLVLTAVLAATVLTAGPALAAPGAVSVSDADLRPCASPTSVPLCSVTSGGGTAAVVDGATAQSGDGYLRLSTPGAGDKAYIREVPGLPLGRLGDLAYSTFVEKAVEGRPNLAPSFNLEVTSSKTSPKDGLPMGFTSLAWEPIYQPATVTPGTWQTWTPSTQKGWWASKDVTATGTENRFGFTTYTATFADVVAALGADATVYYVEINQGSGAGGLQSGVDLFRYGGKTYDFENPATASAITASAGNNQSAAAGQPFPTALAATVTGRSRPVPGTPVVFRVTAGSASFPGGSPTASATTGATGVATAPTLTAGPTPGPVTITATAGSGAATEAVVSTTFSATVTAPPPAAVTDLAVAVSAPPTGRPGNSFVATVRVTNKGGAPVAKASTVVTLTGGLLVVSAPDAVKPAVGTSVTILDGPLAPGATAVHRVTVVGTRAGTAGLQTVTSAAGPDATPADNTATASVRLG
ncbi:hypothetical protein [Pseudonocardia oroxyli]|uniref:Big-1 domain-containing protein n=1 Tax=Pseudonocardia oroxyli TaxID=366584 RepID=A0A1G7ZYN2_PSEOR|nr:hypothetical protein [Pseudonocardia oroxyli]SDH13798.1 hypothetical protein SAMN05216377_11989 [Pseudonocardia oroxyli]